MFESKKFKKSVKPVLALLIFPFFASAFAKADIARSVTCRSNYGRTYLSFDTLELKLGDIAGAVKGVDRLNAIFYPGSDPLEFESQLTDVGLKVSIAKLKCRQDSSVVFSCTGTPGPASFRVSPYWAPWKTENVQIAALAIKTSLANEQLIVVAETQMIVHGNPVQLTWNQVFNASESPKSACSTR